MPKTSKATQFRLSFDVPLGRYFDLARQPLTDQAQPVVVAAKLGLNESDTQEFVQKVAAVRQTIAVPLRPVSTQPSAFDVRYSRLCDVPRGLGGPLPKPPAPEQRDFDLTNILLMERLGLVSRNASVALAMEMEAPANLDQQSPEMLRQIVPYRLPRAGTGQTVIEITQLLEAWGTKLQRFDLDKFLGIDTALAGKAVTFALRQGSRTAGFSEKNIESLFARTAQVTAAQRAGVLLRRSGIAPVTIQYFLGKNAL